MVSEQGFRWAEVVELKDQYLYRSYTKPVDDVGEAHGVGVRHQELEVREGVVEEERRHDLAPVLPLGRVVEVDVAVVDAAPAGQRHRGEPALALALERLSRERKVGSGTGCGAKNHVLEGGAPKGDDAVEISAGKDPCDSRPPPFYYDAPFLRCSEPLAHGSFYV